MKTFILFFTVLLNPLFGQIPNINDLTIEEKVGQTMMPFFYGNWANENARALIQDTHIGNIIYYQWSNGLNSPKEVQELSNGLQKMASQQSHRIPLLIAVDQEGGRVNRLKNGFVVFPSNLEIGCTHNPDFAEHCAYATGEQLKAVGINMNLAPVVDVNSNPTSPIINNRSYSSSPAEVATLGGLALKGYQRAGIIATLKHFPGCGDVGVNPHFGLPINSKNREELDAVELYPFYQLVSDADTIMTTHLLIPALDPHHCVTLSKPIVEGILRQEMGYKGVVISDSLVMQGVLEMCGGSIEEAAIRAFNAGHDLLCIGGKNLAVEFEEELALTEMRNVHHALVEAVRNGGISRERLDVAVERILKLKEKYELFDAALPTADDIVDHVNTLEQQELLRKVDLGGQ